MFVTQYFVELSSLWSQFDLFQDFQVDCPSNAVKFQKLFEKECVYDSLDGLNITYDMLEFKFWGENLSLP